MLSEQLELQSDRQRKSVERIEETLRGLRDEQEQTQLALIAERERAGTLQTELDAAQATINRLRDDLDAAEELRVQLDASHDNCRDLQHTLEQSQETIARLEVDARCVDSLRAKQTSLQQELEDSEDRVQGLTRERDELAADLDAARRDAGQVHAEMVEHADRMEQLREEHVEALSQLEQVNLDRQQAQEALRVLRAEKTQLSSTLENTERKLSGLDAYIVELKEDVSRNDGVVRQLRVEREELLTKFECERNEMGTTILTLRAELDELSVAKDGIAGELEQEKERSRKVEEKLRAAHAELYAERDSVVAELERERSEHEALADGLRNDLAQVQESMDTAQQAKEALEGELQRTMDHYTSLESTWQLQIEELRREALELHEKQQDMTSEMEHERREHGVLADDLRAETAELRQEQERVLAELEAERLRHAQVEAELDSQAESLRQEKERTSVELNDERQKRQQLEEALRLHAETLDQLRANSMSLEELLSRQSAIQASLNRHANQLRVYTGYGDDEIKKRTVAEQASSGGSSLKANDAALGFVYNTPPSYRDDLKLISGIGEILEQRLHGLGVYTYEQIMNWDQDAVREFSHRLSLTDRIEQDEWVEQARRLHDEYYGKAAA